LFRGRVFGCSLSLGRGVGGLPLETGGCAGHCWGGGCWGCGRELVGGPEGVEIQGRRVRRWLLLRRDWALVVVL
jgi:hypothetical protein